MGFFSKKEKKPEEAKPAPEEKPVKAAPAEKPAPAAETGANENIRKALEVVKSYKLAGGRGTMESWFANSFLSGGSSAASFWSMAVAEAGRTVRQVATCEVVTGSPAGLRRPSLYRARK